MLGNHTALSGHFSIKGSLKRNVTSQGHLSPKNIGITCKLLNAKMEKGTGN
jgi:hypothetical protein